MTYLFCVINFFYNWQTLITGFIALLAAYLTVRPLREQIKLQKQEIDSEKVSKAWSAKARLPDALSEICHYTTTAANFLQARGALEAKPPTQAIAEIKDVIANVEKNASKRLFELLSKYQVHKARFRNYLQEINPVRGFQRPAELQDNYYDLAHLHALATSLFDYARNEVDSGPEEGVSKEDMLSSLKQVIGISYYGHEAEYEGVRDAIERRHP